MSKPRSLVFACLILAGSLTALPNVSAAGEATDLLFQEDQIADIETGTTLHYDHQRQGVGGENLHAIPDGEITLSIDQGETGEREALVVMKEGEQQRSLDPFPGSAGNPVLMIFLESSLRSIARVSGGSPFYIRNRFKEAIFSAEAAPEVAAALAGEAVTAREVRVEPFENDKNRDKLGPLANLQLTFLLSDSAPGGFLSMRAETPADETGKVAFLESVTLESVEESE